MKVSVDRRRCVGAGMCALTEPAVFDQDESDGTVLLLDPEPVGERRAGVREAAALCPSGAITVLDG